MIIALDAASTDLSLALADANGTLMDEAAWRSTQRQSAELLPRLLELVGAAGRDLGATSAVAVGTGPGSFTGLRVAMAVAKGLAISLDRPIVGVPSLGAWLDADPDAAAALARAGAREAYLLLRGSDAPVIVDRDALPTQPQGSTLVAPAELAEAWALGGTRSPRGARAIAAAAARRLALDPGGDDVRTLEPIYLRAPRGVATEPRGTVKWL